MFFKEERPTNKGEQTSKGLWDEGPLSLEQGIKKGRASSLYKRENIKYWKMNWVKHSKKSLGTQYSFTGNKKVEALFENNILFTFVMAQDFC